MDRSRFDKWLDPKDLRAMRVGLVGAGTINSWLALSLVRMGFGQFWICDMDQVGGENVSTQPWVNRQVGMGKAEALRGMLIEADPTVLVDTETTPVPEGLETVGKETNFLVVGTDNFESRQAVAGWWGDQWLSGDVKIPVLIEHRMGLTSYECNVVPWGHAYVHEYLKALAEDTNYTEEKCGERSIAFTGLHAASRVSSAMAAVVQATRNGMEAPGGWWVEELGFPAFGLDGFHGVGSSGSVPFRDSGRESASASLSRRRRSEMIYGQSPVGMATSTGRLSGGTPAIPDEAVRPMTTAEIMADDYRTLTRFMEQARQQEARDPAGDDRVDAVNPFEPWGANLVPRQPVEAAPVDETPVDEWEDLEGAVEAEDSAPDGSA